MLRLIAILLAVALTACTFKVFRLPMEDRVLSTTREISREILIFADKLKDDHIYLRQSYAFYDYDVDHFVVWLDFNSQKLLDVAAGRRLLVDMAEKLLERLNENVDAIYGMGGDEPMSFTANNLHIDIELDSFHGRFVDPLYLGRIVLAEGNTSCFYANTALDRRSVVFHQHFEPYESSLFFVLVEKEIEETRGMGVTDQAPLPPAAGTFMNENQVTAHPSTTGSTTGNYKFQEHSYLPSNTGPIGTYIDLPVGDKLKLDTYINQ